MKYSTFFFCMAMLFFVLPLYSNAQNLIKGQVVDKQSKQPLYGATISFNDKANKGITDEYGNFLIKATTGNPTLIVSLIGYKTDTLFNASNETVIALQPNSLQLKEVVLEGSTAAKFNTIAKIDLQLKPVRNTQELLRKIPGLFIAQHAGGGKAEQIFLRGFDADHGTDVQVVVDGMPVNMVSHAHGQGYADAHFIIPETINNIDFGTGPYYANIGNLNTAGYVSFSTYKTIAGSILQVEAGKFSTVRTLATIDLLKKNKNKQSAYIASEFTYTNGPTENKQKFKRYNLFGKYNVNLSNHTQLTASASAFSSNWYASGQIPNRAVKEGIINRFGSIDPTEGGNTSRYNVNLQTNTGFGNGAHWENQFFFSRYIFNLYSNFTFFLNDPVHGDGIQQQEHRYIFGIHSKIKHQHYFGKLHLQSTEGMGLRYDATGNSQLAKQIKRQFISNIMLGDIKEANAFAYTQQQLTSGNWMFAAGLRFDYFYFNYFDKLDVSQNPSQDKTILSPKLNIQYTFNKAMQLYVKAGKGFHSNDSRVVVANKGREILPAAYGADFGIVLKPISNLYLNIAAWYLHLNQEFVYVGDEGVVEASGKTKRQGLDVIARYQFNKNLFASTNINYTKPRAIGEPKGADYIPLAPTLTSTGGLFYKPAKGLNGSLSYRYIKNRPANEDNSVIAKGYFLLDAALNYTIKKYEVGISAENIFNMDWNEAQFDTESRLLNEPMPVTELHYTPGNPIFIKLKLAVHF